LSCIYFLASIFPVCFRDDPQLSDCIVEAVNALKPRLITGDLGEGLRIPKIDPFYIPKYNFTIFYFYIIFQLIFLLTE